VKLRLGTIRFEAERTISLELIDPGGRELPAWTPGAHLEIRLPSGLIRHYSLCGDPADRHTYRVAVLRVAEGRGGSTEVHDSVRVGTLVEVSEPRNHFGLTEATDYLFVAGGIGITPILPMIEQVAHRPAARWRLLYGGRDQQSMAFVDRISALPASSVDLVAEDEAGRPDLAAALALLPPGAHVFGCGPPAMLEKLIELCASHPHLVLHTERFDAGAVAPRPEEDGNSFEVELVRTGSVVQVPADKSVLEVVREIVPDVDFSCESGFCGTCETKMLGGRADHRDSLLTEGEQVANTSMMICVSRAAAGERLRLDL
jgi:ferredoxin-NADP reductase